MINYNLDIENDDKFILGYEYGKMYFKVDGKIECKDVIIPSYSDGHLEYLDDTKENRIMLLNKLKKQIIDSKGVIEEVKALNRGTNLQKYGSYTLMLVSLVYTLNIVTFLIRLFSFKVTPILSIVPDSIVTSFRVLSDDTAPIFIL